MPIANTKDNLSLSECLVERRKFMKLRAADLATRANIPHKYIKKIEAGEWRGLPPGVYAKGFLKKYAKAVGLDENEIAGRYDIELALIRGSAYQPPDSKSIVIETPVRNSKFDLLKKTSVRTMIFSAVGIFIIAYIGWQFSVIFKKPYLDVFYPSEDVSSVTESKMTIEGKVSAGDVLTINGEPVYAESGGVFKKEIELLAGINTLEIKAVSRFGKESKIIRRVTYHQ